MTAEFPQIPFRAQFREAIREGRKTATTRTKPYGEGGDRLTTTLDGVDIKLTAVYQQTLVWVENNLWQEEGLRSRAEFVDIWRSLHRGSWDDERMVWVHRFKLARPSRPSGPPKS
jgi:hypothetical protein